jgi:hypothetical protein
MNQSKQQITNIRLLQIAMYLSSMMFIFAIVIFILGYFQGREITSIHLYSSLFFTCNGFVGIYLFCITYNKINTRIK